MKFHVWFLCCIKSSSLCIPIIYIIIVVFSLICIFFLFNLLLFCIGYLSICNMELFVGGSEILK